MVNVKQPWMAEALKVKGLHERKNNGRLWAWLKSDGATVGDPALIPWCGDFVETAFKNTIGGDVPENPYLALNWRKFGQECKPQYGAVLVFWRGSPDSWQGHVGFYVGEDKTHFHVLGGNQSNAVTVSRISKARLRKRGCRWPDNYPQNGERKKRRAWWLRETTNEA